MPLRVVSNSNQLPKNGIMFSWLSGTLLTNSDLVITKEKEINKLQKRKSKGPIDMEMETEVTTHVTHLGLCV